MASEALCLALLGAVLLALLGAPRSASAAEADCLGTHLASSGRELFTPHVSNIPPPLRAFTWDCASRVPTGTTGEADTREFLLAFTDAEVATVVDILRAFERAGWIVGGSIGATDYGPGDLVQGLSMTADELAGVDTVPDYVRARFGDESTGLDTIELTYTDGFQYTNDVAFDEPSILVLVSASRTYPANGFGDPSILSSLRTITEAAPSPTQVAVVCSASVILMLIVGYPATLLNSVIGGRYDQFAKWMRKTLRARDRERRTPEPRRGTSWLVWPGFVLAAVVAGFVDPSFGPNWMSLRMLLTGFASLALFNLAGWWVVARVMARLQPDAGPYVRFRWGSLLILAGAVLVSRVLEFRPGVIFGLVSGLTFALTLTASRKAVVVLVGSGYALVVSLLGWVGYSFVAPVASGSALGVSAAEFLSGVTIEGIATLPIALLPLVALDGADLVRWKRWVWGAAYTVGLAAFALVLLTIPDSFASYTGDFFWWTLLFVLFAVLAVAVWAVDAAATRRTKSREPDAARVRLD